METTIISWTPTNWATIFLMAFSGFILLKLIASALSAMQGPNGNAVAGDDA